MRKFIFILSLLFSMNSYAASELWDTANLYNMTKGKEAEQLFAGGYITGVVEMYLHSETLLGSKIECKPYSYGDIETAAQHLYNRSDVYKNMPSVELIKSAVQEFCKIEPSDDLTNVRFKVLKDFAEELGKEHK